LCARLVRLGVALVALEWPDGLLIERLLDAGLSVVAVHPSQVRAMRPRYSVAGGKSDVFDSFVLAELARTDIHRFRVLVPDNEQPSTLRATTRARQPMRTRVGLLNQLRDQLACWEGVLLGRHRDRAGVLAPLSLAGRCRGLGSNASRRFSSHVYVHADLAIKEQALAQTVPVNGKAGRPFSAVFLEAF